MRKPKRKPKLRNPGRSTVKGLQDRIADLERQVMIEKQTCQMNFKARQDADARVKQIAAENESLIADKKWLKTLIQNLVSPNDKGTAPYALPR